MISLRKGLLLTGAAALIGTAAFAAQMDHGPRHRHGHGFGMGGRMFEMIDADKDGKVTKAEADKAAAMRFAKISGGKSTISEAQFAAFEPMDRPGREDRKENAFKRIDWNGDGVLSLHEFSAIPEARFIRADRDGTGSITCAPKHPMGPGMGMKDDAMPPPPPPEDDDAGPGPGPGHRGMHHRGMGGGMEACMQADANKDGTLTRAELDASLIATYSSAIKGGTSMTQAQFDAVQAERKAEMRRVMFKHLDKNGDGKLTVAEFSAPEAHMFAMLDKNKDGVIDKSELPHHGPKGRGKPEAN